MSTVYDQQPIGRVVGRRKSREGMAPDSIAREAMTAMAQYRTRAPKGIFFYSSAEEMQADRMKWLVEIMVAKAASHD